MVNNGDSARSFTTSDNNLFLSAFVDYSTDIAVMITTFLTVLLDMAHMEHMYHLEHEQRPEQ